MPPQGAIVAVLAIAGLASSFMFTLVVPIQARLPELLNASREDTAWVVTATLLAAAVITPISGAWATCTASAASCWCCWRCSWPAR